MDRCHGRPLYLIRWVFQNCVHSSSALPTKVICFRLHLCSLQAENKEQSTFLTVWSEGSCCDLRDDHNVATAFKWVVNIHFYVPQSSEKCMDEDGEKEEIVMMYRFSKEVRPLAPEPFFLLLLTVSLAGWLAVNAR